MSNIPETISERHILSVIRDLDSGKLAVPPKQHSTRYCLVYESRHYPPKYLIRMANIKANGEELWAHSGGHETNSFCEKRGFKIIQHGGAPHF